MNSKIGNIYTYNNEKDMLEVANKLEKQGYKVKREAKKFCENLYKNFTVTIIGYKE